MGLTMAPGGCGRNKLFTLLSKLARELCLGPQSRLLVDRRHTRLGQAEASRHYRERTAALAPAAWQSSVTGPLAALFLRGWILSPVAAESGCECRVTPQDVPGYLNGPFRFNVLITVPRA